MADSRICKIDGCSKKRVARGWCDAHYRRWKKYGDPRHRVRRPAGEGLKFLEEVVMNYDGDECLFWPFTRHTWGYGQVWIEGRNRYVHTIVCERVHGERPSESHEAAHLCGNGHEGCVAKQHLSWKTPKENSADKFLHGTVIRGGDQWRSILSEQEVREIRALQGALSSREIAEIFGVSPLHVNAIHRRNCWAWLE